jgi:hypothetical protein
MNFITGAVFCGTVVRRGKRQLVENTNKGKTSQNVHNK